MGYHIYDMDVEVNQGCGPTKAMCVMSMHFKLLMCPLTDFWNFEMAGDLCYQFVITLSGERKKS